MNKEDFKRLYINSRGWEIPSEDLRILDAFYIKEEDDEKFTPKERLTNEQLRYELRNIFVLLKYNYSGYDYYNQNQEIIKIKEDLEKEIIKYPDGLETSAFLELVAKKLNVIIKDNHFSFRYNEQTYRMGISVAPYFTDVVVKGSDDGYEVINNNDYFPVGYIIKNILPSNLFKTLPDGDVERYLIGILQDSNKEILSLNIAGKDLPLHLSRSATRRYGRENTLTSYSSFSFLQLNLCHYDDLNVYYEYGKKLREGDNAIISVVGNPGGSSYVPEKIFEGLKGNGFWDVCGTNLNLFQRSRIPFRCHCNYGMRPKPILNDTYDKTIYVIMNKQTASAGESLVSMSNEAKKVIKVGTNTLGCGMFGEVLCYVLPQSHAYINIPYKTFFMEGFVEGVGFMPDYWLDDADPNKCFLDWYEKK